MHVPKPPLRLTLQTRLRQTTPEERAAWSAAMRRHLTATPQWQAARSVMMFAALGFEPDFIPLIDAASGKRLIFPSMESERIMPRAVPAATSLRLSPGGIREPSIVSCPVVPPGEIDLIIVPGLGFGRDGTRLGRGRGHYDRFLTQLRPGTLLCGACFTCQVMDTMPTEPHDVPMHLLLTEEGCHPIPPATAGDRVDG